jgi:hypothetical protein
MIDIRNNARAGLSSTRQTKMEKPVVNQPSSRVEAEEMIRVATKYLMDHMPERHAR